MRSAIAASVAQLLLAKPLAKRPKRSDQGKRLTKAESARIRELSAAGLNTQEIADRMNVQRSTVYKHLRKSMK